MRRTIFLTLLTILILSGCAGGGRGGPVTRDGDAFVLTGTVDLIEGSAWTVAGQRVDMKPGTVLVETVDVGNVVRVRGRVIQDGAWVADEVVLLPTIIEEGQ